MIIAILPALTLIAALSCGLVAGIFFAFSSFVMAALARVTPEQGIATMQQINITVLNPLFLGLFMGMAVLSLVMMVTAVLRWQETGSFYLLSGGALYLGGTFLVTMLGNVPLNEALAAVDPASNAGMTLWRDYLSSWTTWNHVRTITALVAAGSFTYALI
jgi:uncharacterized membrane protein